MDITGRWIDLPNGVRLSFHEQGDPDGVPMILIPGLADSWRIFGPLIRKIHPAIRLFALSQRGHGDSARPASGYHTKDFAADLELFMDALRLDQAVIVGASSGGFTARTFAVDHPQSTLALVLLGCPPALQDNQMVRQMWDAEISKLRDPVPRSFIERFTRDLFAKPMPPDFLKQTWRENQKLPAHVWRETVRGILDETFPGDLTDITCPTLILWGEADTLLDQLSQEKLAAVIPGSRLIRIKGAGHMLYCDAPEETAARIMAFVETTCPGGAF